MKKIIILTSNGGGGTLSASNAIEEYLKKDYTIKTVYIFAKLLKSIDFCSILTLGKYSCEDVYNILIARKYFKVLALLYYVGKYYIRFKKKYIKSTLKQYLINNKPDIIISVVPIINDIILSVAQELNIFFLLIPTDLDISMYVINIHQYNYSKFYLGLPFKNAYLEKPLHNACLTSSHLITLGAPLKSSFFTEKNIPLLKKEFNIPFDKPVIMLIMGAQGSNGIYHYIQELIQISHSMHLIICIGKHNNFVMPTNVAPHISISIIKFTSRIADLMAISDLIISKSGSLSVCEALYMNKPLLLDATSTVLPWEKLNHTFIQKYTYGTSIYRYKDIVPLVSSLLFEKKQLKNYTLNINTIQKLNFQQTIMSAVDNLAE